MKRRGIEHLAGTLIAAFYLLAVSPVAAQYTIVPLSKEGGLQANGMATFAAATVTADASDCLGAVDGFEILATGPANTFQIFTVTQTVPGIMGFSFSESGPFEDTLSVRVDIDSSGQGKSDPFYLHGAKLGLTEVSICNEQQRCVWDQVSIVVVNVASIEWEADKSPLDTNPNAKGGQRIFPEKTSAIDQEDRTTVAVKVKVSDAISDRPVYVKAFDVDDPSTDNTVIDRDGSGGIDNLGTTPSISKESGIGVGFGITGPDGVARLTFHVSKQPGDNFRIAGACLLRDRDGLRVDGLEVKDDSGQTLPTELAKVSPLLTVWRRLHIEIDTMEPVQGNFVAGTVEKVRATGKGTTVVTLKDKLEDYRRFKKGRITIEDVGAFPVVDAGGSTVTVTGLVNTGAADKPFKLVDDDDFNNDDGDNLDGDEGEALPEPDRSWVKDSDLPAENAFAVAYVKPAYDLSNNPHPKVPFAQNSDFLYSHFDNFRLNDKNFWTAYLLGAYQYLTVEDGDPDEDVTQWGRGSESYGANVFLEVGRPEETSRYANKAAFVNQAATTAHELGHWFQQDNDDSKTDPEGGLMCGPRERRKGTFSDKTIFLIRNKYNNLP